MIRRVVKQDPALPAPAIAISTAGISPKAPPADLRELIRLIVEYRSDANLVGYAPLKPQGASAAVFKGVRGIRQLQEAKEDAYNRDSAMNYPVPAMPPLATPK